jgi:hypothetical protein
LNRHLLERPVVSVGVHAQRHRCAGAERGEQQVIGGRAEVVADTEWFVGDETMPPGLDRLG